MMSDLDASTGQNETKLLSLDNEITASSRTPRSRGPATDTVLGHSVSVDEVSATSDKNIFDDDRAASMEGIENAPTSPVVEGDLLTSLEQQDKKETGGEDWEDKDEFLLENAEKFFGEQGDDDEEEEVFLGDDDTLTADEEEYVGDKATEFLEDNDDENFIQGGLLNNEDLTNVNNLHLLDGLQDLGPDGERGQLAVQSKELSVNDPAYRIPRRVVADHDSSDDDLGGYKEKSSRGSRPRPRGPSGPTDGKGASGPVAHVPVVTSTGASKEAVLPLGSLLVPSGAQNTRESNSPLERRRGPNNQSPGTQTSPSTTIVPPEAKDIWGSNSFGGGLTLGAPPGVGLPTLPDSLLGAPPGVGLPTLQDYPMGAPGLTPGLTPGLVSGIGGRDPMGAYGLTPGLDSGLVSGIGGRDPMGAHGLTSGLDSSLLGGVGGRDLLAEDLSSAMSAISLTSNFAGKQQNISKQMDEMISAGGNDWAQGSMASLSEAPTKTGRDQKTKSKKDEETKKSNASGDLDPRLKAIVPNGLFTHPRHYFEFILSLTTKSVHGALQGLAPLPRQYVYNRQSHMQDIITYYRNFIPWILEESRAVIYQGLDKYQNKGIARPFTLYLKRADDSGPYGQYKLEFEGSIQSADEHSSNMNVLLLMLENNQGKEIPVISLAKEPWGKLGQEVKTVSATVKLDTKQVDSFRELFHGEIDASGGNGKKNKDKNQGYKNNRKKQSGKPVRAVYLGNLVTTQRMYDACINRNNDSSALEELLPGHLECFKSATLDLKTRNSWDVSGSKRNSGGGGASSNDLNAAQKAAVMTFSCMPKGSMLLQGPPGTGKTTTLVSILEELSVKRTRTLVCAPSNKAIQVLAARFHDRVPSARMVLVGVADKIPPELKAVSLEGFCDDLQGRLTQIKRYIVLFDYKKNPKIALAVLLGYIEAMTAMIGSIYKSCMDVEVGSQKMKMAYNYSQEILEAAMDRRTLPVPHTNIALGVIFNQYPSFHTDFQNKVDMIEKNINTVMESIKERKRDIEESLLENAQIVFCTLATSGSSTLTYNHLQASIDTLIIDEASQCIEAEALIAFQHRPERVLLVGDTKQLPATVISPQAKGGHFDWSMMWRLAEECRAPNCMITEQYRMHPEICQWPSRRFYQDQLVTAKSLNFHNTHATGLQRPYAFYAMEGVDNKEQRQGNSVLNHKESDYVTAIVKKIRDTDKRSTIGVITFYAAQRAKIERSLFTVSKELCNSVECSTVDGFQGDECDIIIISFVRSNPKNTVGFLSDFRRLNVALTRARKSIIMLGEPSTLCTSKEIGALLGDAQQRDKLFSEFSLKSLLGAGLPGKAASRMEEGKSQGGSDQKKKSQNGPYSDNNYGNSQMNVSAAPYIPLSSEHHGAAVPRDIYVSSYGPSYSDPTASAGHSPWQSATSGGRPDLNAHAAGLNVAAQEWNASSTRDGGYGSPKDNKNGKDNKKDKKGKDGSGSNNNGSSGNKAGERGEINHRGRDANVNVSINGKVPGENPPPPAYRIMKDLLLSIMRQEGVRELNFEHMKESPIKSISKSQVNNATSVTKSMRIALDLYMQMRPRAKENLATMKQDLLRHMDKEGIESLYVGNHKEVSRTHLQNETSMQCYVRKAYYMHIESKRWKEGDGGVTAGYMAAPGKDKDRKDGNGKNAGNSSGNSNSHKSKGNKDKSTNDGWKVAR